MKTQFLTEADLVVARMGAEIVLAGNVNDAIAKELAEAKEELARLKAQIKLQSENKEEDNASHL